MSVRDPRTPLLAKLVAAVVVAYALSPIDLIPDFIPVLGQLDDLILVPLGLWIAVRLVPSHVIAEARARARSGERLPVSRAAGFAIASIWAAALAGAAWMLLRAY
ncbi:MAG: DUF1232 domain-containing protein [Beijerinckiaceae bacterium]|nr:DUF1232 domain-containing protein [Beijerinckiaceae bacterium]